MINVYGNVMLKVDFDINLDMSEEEFEALSERKQNELIDSTIDWHNTMQGAEIDEIEVFEFREASVELDEN